MEKKMQRILAALLLALIAGCSSASENRADTVVDENSISNAASVQATDAENAGTDDPGNAVSPDLNVTGNARVQETSASRSEDDGCARTVGRWVGERRGQVLIVDIRKVDGIYIVRSDDNDGVSSDANEMPATCDGTTLVKQGMLGNAVYVPSEDTIYFAGMQLARAAN
jgi:hypothetical protein